jgi:hypothetical protein
MPAALSPNACAVSAATMLAASMPATMLAASMPATMLAAAMPATMLAATMPASMLATTMPAATMPAATPAGVCFECEKRHYEEQRSRQASRQHRPHGPAGLGARRRRLSLGIRPKSF